MVDGLGDVGGGLGRRARLHEQHGMNLALYK
jgi:hypothetical protein